MDAPSDVTSLMLRLTTFMEVESSPSAESLMHLLRRYNEVFNETEDEACSDLFSRLVQDPTTRAG